ncbi:hypothetical protein JTB14_009837 [Gonioctena quinquepunctata]|nr:hypothetical protein JTB14_009837 [Gonioctena quinquepunctata]
MCDTMASAKATMGSVKATKRPLRTLSAHEKLEAIRRVHDGESKASVARDIGVPESTLRGWCKNEDKISYLSRQSSPETDESLEHPSQVKKPKFEEPSMQPFNLSLKISGASYSPNGALDFSKTKVDSSKKASNLNVKADTPKSTNQITERERNRAELARLSVELGLNRPEMYMSGLNNTSANLADLSANVGLLAQWNSLLLQQQQKQHSTPKTANKVTAPAATSGASASSGGLLTIADQDKNKQLPMEKQSVHESVRYWLKTHQSMLNFNHAQTTLSNPPTSNGISTPTSVANNTSAPSLNGMSPDQSSWFWKWYKQFAYSQQVQQLAAQDTKPILYQQLTKDVPQNSVSPPPQFHFAADQQNAENLSMHDERHKISDKIANNKARSVLDNLLFNNNNNVNLNIKQEKLEEEGLSQSEAVEHGEKFLMWLESCSDPSVTAMQIMQFRTLLNNVKIGADRKNGDLQNKAKVKRK